MSSMENSHRLVHLDLKGAAPKIEYFEQLFPLLKQLGATGLLVEYEDMFPYWGDLEDLASTYCYTKDNIGQMLQLAKDNDLIFIPLIQSFGHFEFVLKHEKFYSLREVPAYPMALCPSNPDSLMAVSMMIDQVMELHPGLRWFHIGADEVYHLGACDRCKKRMQTENLSTQQLFFTHIRAVCMHLKAKYPDITIIMWDDMMRFVELPVLIESGLDTLVEPMIWHYLPSFLLPADIWDRFSKVFPNIWIASAFKGATGACVYTTNVMYHVDNHQMWLAIMEREGSKFQNIRGIAVTGWQRYDHFAILCELLPQGIPSLAVCLQVICKGALSLDVHTEVSHKLKFQGLLPVNPFQGTDIPVCEFPGSDVYSQMIELLRLETVYEDFLHSEGKQTWLNKYHTQKNFTNPMHVEPLLGQATKILSGLGQLHRKLQKSLSAIFYPNTVEEVCSVYLEPKIEKLATFVEAAQRQLDLSQSMLNKVKDMQT